MFNNSVISATHKKTLSYICRTCRGTTNYTLSDFVICPKCGDRMIPVLYDVDKWNKERIDKRASA